MKTSTFTQNDLALKNFLAALASDCFEDRKMAWRHGLLDIPGRKALIGEVLEAGQFRSATPAVKVVVRRVLANSYRLEVMYRGEWLIDPKRSKLHPINSAQVRLLWPCVTNAIDSEPFYLDPMEDEEIPALAKKLGTVEMDR